MNKKPEYQQQVFYAIGNLIFPANPKPAEIGNAMLLVLERKMKIEK